jgi:two-component system, LytTR family, sensor kinase
MNNTKEDNKSIDNIYIRIIGISLIGIFMPILFYTGSDFNVLLRWIIISLLITFTAWEISRHIVAFLWRKYPWEDSALKHLLMMILFLTTLTVLLAVIIYYINYLFDNVSNGYWATMKGVHLAILLLTFFSTSVYEGIFLFHKWKKTLILSASLERENIKSQFETLKNQVNPHFLFNSLNTLSSLITENPDKAVEFVNEFSSIYRYVLDVKDLNAVKLQEELDFVRSYVYLQKIRYGENLDVIIDIEEHMLQSSLMPLSLQVLIENAVKHNEISDAFPLKIEITSTGTSVVVKNNLNKTLYHSDSPKMGLSNLTARYNLISDNTPDFRQNENEFIAEIPLLSEI